MNVPWSKHTQHGRAGQCRNGGALVAYFYHATPPLGLRELPEGRQRMLENGKLKQRPTLVAFWIILEFGILLILANDQIDRIMFFLGWWKFSMIQIQIISGIQTQVL